jgi:hypothetical protein
VCTNGKCAVHGFAAAQTRGSTQDKEKRAKAKAKTEALTRMRIFQAIFEASSEVQLQDEDYLPVSEFAICGQITTAGAHGKGGRVGEGAFQLGRPPEAPHATCRG